MKKIIDINKWPDGYGPVLFVEKLKTALSDTQIAAVLDAIETTCTHCWCNEKRCYCTRDD